MHRLRDKNKCDQCGKSPSKIEPSLYFSRFLDKWVCWKCLNEEIEKLAEYKGN